VRDCATKQEMNSRSDSVPARPRFNSDDGVILRLQAAFFDGIVFTGLDDSRISASRKLSGFHGGFSPGKSASGH